MASFCYGKDTDCDIHLETEFSGACYTSDDSIEGSDASFTIVEDFPSNKWTIKNPGPQDGDEEVMGSLFGYCFRNNTMEGNPNCDNSIDGNTRVEWLKRVKATQSGDKIFIACLYMSWGSELVNETTNAIKRGVKLYLCIDVDKNTNWGSWTDLKTWIDAGAIWIPLAWSNFMYSPNQEHPYLCSQGFKQGGCDPQKITCSGQDANDGNYCKTGQRDDGGCLYWNNCQFSAFFHTKLLAIKSADGSRDSTYIGSMNIAGHKDKEVGLIIDSTEITDDAMVIANQYVLCYVIQEQLGWGWGPTCSWGPNGSDCGSGETQPITDSSIDSNLPSWVSFKAQTGGVRYLPGSPESPWKSWKDPLSDDLIAPYLDMFPTQSLQASYSVQKPLSCKLTSTQAQQYFVCNLPEPWNHPSGAVGGSVTFDEDLGETGGMTNQSALVSSDAKIYISAGPSQFCTSDSGRTFEMWAFQNILNCAQNEICIQQMQIGFGYVTGDTLNNSIDRRAPGYWFPFRQALLDAVKRGVIVRIMVAMINGNDPEDQAANEMGGAGAPYTLADFVAEANGQDNCKGALLYKTVALLKKQGTDESSGSYNPNGPCNFWGGECQYTDASADGTCQKGVNAGECLQRANVNEPGVFHCKWMICDNTVFINEQNFTPVYFAHGAGLSWVVKDCPVLRDFFYNIFNRDWSSDYAYDLDVTWPQCEGSKALLSPDWAKGALYTRSDSSFDNPIGDQFFDKDGKTLLRCADGSPPTPGGCCFPDKESTWNWPRKESFTQVSTTKPAPRTTMFAGGSTRPAPRTTRPGATTRPVPSSTSHVTEDSSSNKGANIGLGIGLGVAVIIGIALFMRKGLPRRKMGLGITTLIVIGLVVALIVVNVKSSSSTPGPPGPHKSEGNQSLPPGRSYGPIDKVVIPNDSYDDPEVMRIHKILIQKYPSIGGIPFEKLCPVMTDPECHDGSCDLSDPDNIAKGIKACKDNWSEYQDMIYSTMYRWWKAQVFTSVNQDPAVDPEKWCPDAKSGDGCSSSLLKDPDVACPALVNDTIPRVCKDWTDDETFPDFVDWVDDCAAFTQYYDLSFKSVNYWVDFCTKFLDEFKKDPLGSDLDKVFQKYLYCLVRRGCLRWNGGQYYEVKDGSVQFNGAKFFNEFKDNIGSKHGYYDNFKTLMNTADLCENSYQALKDDPASEQSENYCSMGMPSSYLIGVAGTLDNAITTMPKNPIDLVLWKGLENDPCYVSYMEKYIHYKPGDVFSFDGYCSTTFAVGVSQHYSCGGRFDNEALAALPALDGFDNLKSVKGRNYCGIFKIYIPEGRLNVHYKHDSSNYVFQVLLPRQCEFRVIRLNKEVPFYNEDGDILAYYIVLEVEATGTYAKDRLDFNDRSMFPLEIAPWFDEDPFVTPNWMFKNNPDWVQRLYQLYVEFTGADPLIMSAPATAMASSACRDLGAAAHQQAHGSTKSDSEHALWQMLGYRTHPFEKDGLYWSALMGLSNLMWDAEVNLCSFNAQPGCDPFKNLPPIPSREVIEVLMYVGAGPGEYDEQTMINHNTADAYGDIAYVAGQMPVGGGADEWYRSSWLYKTKVTMALPFGGYLTCNRNGKIHGAFGPHICATGSGMKHHQYKTCWWNSDDPDCTMGDDESSHVK